MECKWSFLCHDMPFWYLLTSSFPITHTPTGIQNVPDEIQYCHELVFLDLSTNPLGRCVWCVCVCGWVCACVRVCGMCACVCVCVCVYVCMCLRGVLYAVCSVSGPSIYCTSVLPPLPSLPPPYSLCDGITELRQLRTLILNDCQIEELPPNLGK